MISFFGEQCLKEAVVERVREHQRLDQIIQKIYWAQQADGIYRGCAIGCVLHSGNHMDYERQLGLPVFLAYIDEHIFESLPARESTAWPLRFIEAVPVGVDLEMVHPRFMHWLMTDPRGARQFVASQDVKIFDAVAKLYSDWITAGAFAAQAEARAEQAAENAAASAVSNSAQAAAAHALHAAESAAWSAAWSTAASAAASPSLRAKHAVWSAAWSAAASPSLRAKHAVWRRQIHRQAEYLIELLQSYESAPLPGRPCVERDRFLVTRGLA